MRSYGELTGTMAWSHSWRVGLGYIEWVQWFLIRGWCGSMVGASLGSGEVFLWLPLMTTRQFSYNEVTALTELLGIVSLSHFKSWSTLLTHWRNWDWKWKIIEADALKIREGFGLQQRLIYFHDVRFPFSSEDCKMIKSVVSAAMRTYRPKKLTGHRRKSTDSITRQ